MSGVGDPPGGPGGDERPTVSEVIEVSDRGEGFAYVPREVLVRASAAGRLSELTGQQAEFIAEREAGRQGQGWQLARNVPNLIEHIDQLVGEGLEAQPNHVLFLNSAECPPHPALVNALIRSGELSLPADANPAPAAPIVANPMGANPMGANSMQNTAVPAGDRSLPARTLVGSGPIPHIVVLDTGLAREPRQTEPAADDHTPPLFVEAAAADPANRIDGALDLPDVDITRPSGIAVADNFLDPAAGHGTFIAGIIEQLAPGCPIAVRRVIGPLGNADEKQVANEIHDVVDDVETGSLQQQPVILNLSFGGRALEQPHLLGEAVTRALEAGIVIIASAGNEGVCAPQYPAAFPGVIAVAAVGPDGPPPWTNYGDWVDACAPGVDLVSAFFDNWDGAFSTASGADPDRFSGWATWSGTSFAVPVVVAAVARELVCGPAPDNNNDEVALLAAAVERVVRAPHLARLPLLGTVVNI